MLRERVYDTQALVNEMHNHLDYPNHTLILAPRRSGKSILLMELFKRSQNYAYVGHSLGSHIIRNHHIERDLHPHVYTANSTYIHRRYDTVLIDELFSYRDPKKTLATFLPHCRRVIVVSTPSHEFDVEFPFTVNVCRILDGTERRPLYKKNHFIEQEELFTI